MARRGLFSGTIGDAVGVPSGVSFTEPRAEGSGRASLRRGFRTLFGRSKGSSAAGSP